jgi:hypothetical protein
LVVRYSQETVQRADRGEAVADLRCVLDRLVRLLYGLTQ